MSTENEQLVERFAKAWSSGDLEAILACVSADVVYDAVGAGIISHGREQFAGFATAVLTAVPEIQWLIDRTYAAGNVVSCEWRLTGTQTGDFPGIPATGNSFEVRGASIIECADGKVVASRDYWNVADLLRQVGLLPEATA